MGIPFSRLDNYREFLLVEDVLSYSQGSPSVPVYKKTGSEFAHHIQKNLGIKMDPEILVIGITQ